MAAPESTAVPPKDPFRTRRQLPRTPLSSKSGNRSRLPGSRARSASPGVTKIPRSSHIARSESPTRASAGLGTPTGRAAAAGQETAVESVNENVSAAVTVTTPVADTRRIEEEMLAAFARTPKVVRTPPKSSGTAVASSAREERADGRSTAQLPAPQLAAAAAAPAPGAGVPPPRRAGRQPATALPAATTAASAAGAPEVPDAGPVGAQGAPAAEPPAEQVFRGRAKLSRTSPLSGEAAGVDAQAKSNTGNQPPPPPPPPPQQQQQQGLGFPPARESGRSVPVEQPTAPPAGGGGGGGATGSPSRFASPSVSADSSCTNAANVRSLLGSDSKMADALGGGGPAHRGRAGAALTPAAFEGLISVMRTPLTGMKRRGALVSEVPQMKSLDAVKAPPAHRPANAPRGNVPPRATNRTGTARPRYASSVEEAKAAAEAAAKATAAKKAITATTAAAAAAAAVAAGAPTTTGEEPAAAAPADDVRAPPESAPAAAASAGGLLAPPAVVGESDVGPAVSDSLPRVEEEVTDQPPVLAAENGRKASAASRGPGTASGAVGLHETIDPFGRSQKLPRTPTTVPAPTPPAVEATAAPTAEVTPRSPHPSAGNDGVVDGVLKSKGQPGAAATPVPPEGGKEGAGSPRGVAVAETAGNPFASRSNIPRTPADKVVPPPPLSLFDEGGGGGRVGDPVAMDLEGARLQIRELNQELACKRDSLAKQAEERKRLADAAFEAQDEAAKLRQRLEEIQAQIQDHGQTQLNEDGGGGDGPTGGNGNGTGTSSTEGVDGGEMAQGPAEDGSSLANREMGEDGQGREGERGGGAGARAGTAVELTAGRVVQLEIEKWETEQGKREAEKEAERAGEAARQTKAALDEAQTKVLELTVSAEARQEEMLAENLRKAREQCKQDERAIEEHEIKVKLFVADKRAEILRAQVSEEERLKAEQTVRAAAVAVAGKACKVVQEFVARNARMSSRVAGLRANVEEREKVVSQLKERSALLEASGESAKHETEAVRDLLAAATQELAAVKRSSEALEARLGPLEQECREAHTAQENLRALVDAEEARRVSVEQRLSEVKRSGENVVGIERARRQSTERRLGLAERTRDELAAAASAAAGTALREAAATEKSRRMSVERRLEYAERARTELSATVAESAASAAAAAASAAAASTAASEAAALSRPTGPTVAAAAVTLPPPAASAPAPKAKAVKPAAKKSKSTKEPESAAAVDGAAASNGGGAGASSSSPKRVNKRAHTVEDGKDGKAKKKSTPAKAAKRRRPSPSKKRTQTATAVRTKSTGGTRDAPPARAAPDSPSDSDSDFDGDAAAAAPTRTEPAPTITTGRTGRKRKQINYAEPSPLLDRSVIAALSDTSDDEYEDDPPAPAPRSKEKPAPVAPARKKTPAAAAGVADVAGANAAPATKAASPSAVRPVKESGEEAAASETSTAATGKGKGKGKVKDDVGGGKSASAKAGAATVVEKPEKKRRRSTAAAKKGDNTPVDAAAAEGGGSVPAAAGQGSKKAGRKSVGRASKAKAVEKPQQEPQQGASVPKPLLTGGDAEVAGAGAGAGADLLSTDLSPIAPPQKRARKLLGGGTSRCKTPKAKKKAAAAAAAATAAGASRAEDDDENSAVPPTALAATEASVASAPQAGTAGALPAPRAVGVGPRSGSSAAAAAMVSRAPAASETAKGAGSGTGRGGGAAAAKPAVKPLKLSTNSILAMRGKSTMRTSLFKGFLDPKNGFKAPKLKAGALRR